MSHLTQSMVEQFFAREEENARGVLRKEMDSAMDTIFKQMKRKLMMLVESGHLANETGHGLAHLGEPTDREQQLSNDTSHISSATNSQAQFGDVNASNLSLQGGSGDRVPHEQQLSSRTYQIPSTSTDSFVPDNANSNQSGKITVKNELGELVNIITMPTSSTQSQLSNNNDKDDNLFDELDYDEEDCDCSECMEGCSVNEEEGDDADENSHSKDLIDESNDASSRPTKRPRLENVQVQAQSNNQTNSTQVITISLKCSRCSEIFQDRDALNAHLKSVHSIKKYRCLYKDCNRSFDKNTAHSIRPNATWPCGYCSGHYKDSCALYRHYSMQHEEGLFQCAHPDCQFVGELKQTVLNHFGANHKIFVCQHPGCTKQYSKAAKLKIHERTHLNARPYRCKWPNCEYAGSAHKYHAIRHIREHLAKITKKRKGISQDPKDYLEVVNELL